MTFFDSWALWQKMSFVLACAIVVTVSLGVTKLLHNKRQLRFYAASSRLEASAQDQAIGTVYTDDVEANYGKIPFGIRAIESGVEVDGVCISPASSRPSSFTSSRRHLPTTLSQGSLLPPDSPDKSAFASSRSSIRSGESHLGRSSAAQRTNSATSLISVDPVRPGVAQRVRSSNSLFSAEPPPPSPRSSSAANHDRIRGRSLPRDLSFLDLAHPVAWTPMSPRLSTILDEPSTDPPSSTAQDPPHSRDDSPAKHAAQDSVDTVSSLATNGASTDLLPTDTTPKTKTSFTSVDSRTSELSTIEQHRLQQAASTGQLKPRRGRQPNTSKLEEDDSVPPLPQIRLQQVGDDLQEHDLGLLRTDTGRFSFVEGEADTLQGTSTPLVSDTRDSSKKSRLGRPYFARVRTDSAGSHSSVVDLFRAATHQPQQADYAGMRPLRRVKARLGREDPSDFQAVQTHLADIDMRSNPDVPSTTPRIPRKLQKKERALQSSLRQKFMIAMKERGEKHNEQGQPLTD